MGLARLRQPFCSVPFYLSLCGLSVRRKCVQIGWGKLLGSFLQLQSEDMLIILPHHSDILFLYSGKQDKVDSYICSVLWVGIYFTIRCCCLPAQQRETRILKAVHISSCQLLQ